MDRSGVLLAALAAGGVGAKYSPIQVQKLLFLIDREIPDYIGGPHFNFQPYQCGPYDQTVFEEAERQAEYGNVIIDENGPSSTYSLYYLSDTGLNDGLSALKRMPRAASRYMVKAAKWVQRQSFRTLVSAIYRDYPDMAVNSVIPELALQGQERARKRRMNPFLQGMASVIYVANYLGEEELTQKTPAEQDAIAIAGVWRAVGDDLRSAIQHEEVARHRWLPRVRWRSLSSREGETPR